MANAEQVSDYPSTSSRKRPYLHDSEYPEQDGAADMDLRKKSRTISNGTWANLDLVLTLQRKDTSLERKIKIAFDYVKSIGDGDDQSREVVRLPRLVSFLIDWIQPTLIASESGKRDSELCDPCLDYRCWVVLQFCLQNSSASVSPNLLRAITRVLQHALLQFAGDSLLHGEELYLLFNHVLDCLSVLLSRCRAFHSSGVELWVSCGVEVVNLVCKVLTSDELRTSSAEVLLTLSSLLLEHFSVFLRFHPNPRNVFRAFIDRLLEPLLELLILLQLRVNGGKCEKEDSLLSMVNEILSNGVFHPAHISGFLSKRSSNAEQAGRQQKSINESYHRHLFQRLEKMIADKKAVPLGGFGYLLCLFINKAKSHNKVANLSSMVNVASGKHPQIKEESEKTSKPLFGIFTQFLEPLVLECKKCTELDLSQDVEILELRLVEGHCMLKSVNETLASFVAEKIYVPTEDNSEESHFNFLKKVNDIIFSVSAKIYLFWLSMLHKDNVGIKRILPLVAKEIFVAVGYLLEAEYKAIGNNLVELWLMVLSYLTIQMHLGDTTTCSSLVSEILKLSTQLINIYSELRQVHSPIFALCKAARLFTVVSDADSVGSSSFLASSPLCSEICLKSMTTLLNSETCRLAISASIKSIPERQANGCVQQLIIDIGDAFDWIKYGHLSDCIYLSETSTLTGGFLVLGVQAELFGRFLSEIYTIILDSFTITATNSVLVGNSVDNLIKSLSPSFNHLIQSSSRDGNDFIYSITGQKLSIEESPEHRNGSQTIPTIMSWFFVFYFRMYTYCRSLYRQSISLLPPNSAKKASDVMGNLFCVSSGLGWRNNLKFLDSGYFSWAIKPSVSLLDVIHNLSEGFLSSSFLAYAPLVYVLHVMAIQRISDLNRMLKAYEFLQDKSPKVSQAPLGNHDILKSSKQLNRLISTSRSEAKKLTKFLCGYLPVLASDGKCICSESLKSCEVTRLVSDGGNLDTDVSLPDDNSLPGPLWLLLCRNIDVWCPHASNKALKTFFSNLLLYSLPCCGSALEEPRLGEPLLTKINMHKVALELISDCILYEQPALSKYVTSRLCRALKKSFTSLMNHSNASCKDFYSLSEWSEILNRSFLDPAACKGGTDTSPAYSSLSVSNFILSDISGWQSCPFQMQLKVCEALLHLLCKMPGVHITASSFTVYATCILNLERLVVSNLRKSHCDSLVSNSCGLLRLFVACRRAMKHIATSVEQIVQKSYLSTVFNHPTILWLLKSADELVGLPYASFGDKYYDQIETMKFALVDHTSYIFMTVIRAVVNLPLALHAMLFDGKLHKKLSLDSDTCKENAYNLANQHSQTSENIETWRLLEIFPEILAHQARDSTSMLKDMIHAVEQETDHSILNWNRLSCLVSCLQGFLWGLASILDGINDHLTDNQELPICSLSRLSTLGNYIILFENFVYYCISILIFSDQQGTEIQQMRNLIDKNLLRNIVACASECSFGEDQFSFGNYSMLHNQGKSRCNYCDGDIKCPSDDGHIMNSTIRKGKSLTIPRKHVVNAFRGIYDINFSNLHHLRVSFFHSLLEGRNRHLAFMVRQLFLASAAIIKLRCTLLFPIGPQSHKCCRQLSPNSMIDLLVSSHIILQGVAEMAGRPDPFTFVWVDGILKYLEVVGSYINLTDPNLSKEVYGHLVDIHLRAMGKCISLQGKSATLLSHETGTNIKMLQRETPVIVHLKQSIYARDNVINEFKGRLRLSFIKFIERPTKVHLKLAAQSIERALSGMHQGCHMVYEVTTGNSDGGRVSPIVAGGIDCLDLLLEFASGQKQVIKESISSLVVCLFNVVVHLQHPKIFYTDMKPHDKTHVDPDAGSVILMCVEVLVTVVGKHSFQMDRGHASQCMHIPMVLFKDFHQLRDSLERPQSTYNPEIGSFENVHNYIVDRQFSVDLYSSCCKLLYTTLKHQICSEVEQCVAILQESVVTLLNCLETVGANSLGRKGYFAWNMQEAIKSASFLRRIYEEIRQQKDVVGRFSIYFLSSYISLYSGFGPLQAGIKREIDEALRPGIYSLIDICTSNDIQQLHTVLEESSCRSTLSTLLHDYKLNFQFEGKV